LSGEIYSSSRPPHYLSHPSSPSSSSLPLSLLLLHPPPHYLSPSFLHILLLTTSLPPSSSLLLSLLALLFLLPLSLLPLPLPPSLSHYAIKQEFSNCEYNANPHIYPGVLIIEQVRKWMERNEGGEVVRRIEMKEGERQ
jgi:hypothetical protein